MQRAAKKQSHTAVAGSRQSVVSWGQLRQTNPIPAEKEEEVGRGRPRCEEIIVRNKANLAVAGSL